MQIVNATVESMDFFCPVTGQKILGDDGTFSPSKATKGYWVNELPDEPEITDKGLAQSWKQWLTSVDQDDFIDCSAFFEQYDADNWVAFALQSRGMPGDIGYIVIDMAGHE